MSFIITVANYKGGCGKSTLSMLLAGCIAQMTQLRVVVADSDPQGTACLWGSLRPGSFPAPVVAVERDIAEAHLAKLVGEYDCVIVDCPPNIDSPLFHAALSSADLAVIPCAPDPTEMWCTELMLDFCRTLYPDVRLMVVVNKIPTKTVLSAQSLEFIRATWPVAQATLGLRTAYKEAAAIGGTLAALQGKGARDARREVEALAMEVLGALMAPRTAAAPAVQEATQKAPEVLPQPEAPAQAPTESEPRRGWAWGAAFTKAKPAKSTAPASTTEEAT